MPSQESDIRLGITKANDSKKIRKCIGGDHSYNNIFGNVFCAHYQRLFCKTGFMKINVTTVRPHNVFSERENV